MLPTYTPGTIVLGLSWLRPRVGSVVILRRDGREMVKRVARLGKQGIYVVGDNPDQSTDSRTFGWIEPASIRSVIIGSITR